MAAPGQTVMSASIPQSLRSALIVVFLLSFVGLQAVGMVYKTPLGAPPDERAHLSYIHDVMQPGGWMPDYRAGGIYLMEDNINYLMHPPLYYIAMGVVGSLAGWDVYAQIHQFRLLNVGLVLIGLGFFIGFCRRMELNWPVTSVLTLSLTAVPMFAYYAGSVNNDNLVYTAVAIVLFGLAQGTARSPHPSAPALLPGFGWVAVGYTIAALTKVTAGAFLTFFLLFYLLLEWRRLSLFFQQSAFWVNAFGAVLVVGGYYLFAHWQYGSFLPSPRYLYVLTPPEDLMTFSEYAQAFWRFMTTRASGVMAHISFTPMIGVAVKFYHWMFLGPLLVWLILRFIPAFRHPDPTRTRLADSLVLAVLAVLALHLHIGYGAYSNTGVLGGMQPRYYLYLAPLVLAPAFFLLKRHEIQTLLALPLAALVIISFWASVPFAQERQYIEISDRHPPLVFKTDENEWPVEIQGVDMRLRLQTDLVGSLDEFWLERDVVYARGWVFDKSDNQPVTRVMLMLQDEVIGSRASNISRPDVRAALALPQAERTGFAFYTYGIPEDTELCEISLLVEFQDGSHGVMEPGECTQWIFLSE